MADNQIKLTRIDLAAKMDDLSNNEVLGVAEDFFCNYLQNADIFYEKSLAIRPGTEDLCGGFVWGKFNSTKLIDTLSGIASGTNSYSYDTLFSVTDNQEHEGFIFIPTRDTVLKSGTFVVRGDEIPSSFAALGKEAQYDIDVRLMIFPLDQMTVSASGYTTMSGIGPTSSGFHDIRLANGNVAVPPYPTINPRTTPFSTGVSPIGIAEKRINLGAYTFDNPDYVTLDTTVNMVFNAPIPISGSIAYYGRLVYSLTSGTQYRDIAFKTVSNSVVDLSPNSVLVDEFQYAGTATFPAQNYALKTNFGGYSYKTWPVMNLWSYDSCDFLNPDLPSANHTLRTPFVSGLNINLVNQALGNYKAGNPSAEFGQLLYLPSGTTYYGAYLYAAPENPTGDYKFYDANGIALSGTKQVGIAVKLSLITSHVGDPSLATYVADSISGVAVNSGSFTFDFSNPYNNAGVSNNNEFNYRLNKIYTIFDVPVSLSQSGHYLLSYDWYDLETGGEYKDYALRVGGGGNTYISALGIGANSATPAQGAFLYNYSGVGSYQQIPTGIYTNSPAYDLTCGLIAVPSGSWINGIYDYRIGGDRVSKIVYGQGQYVRNFELSNPNKAGHVQIFSSGSTLQDALWNSTTYDDLLFSHQYSQISGVCWDQIYLNPSGYNSMQVHGQRPSFSISFQSGVGTVGSNSAGVVQVMLATEMDSGGFRASEIKSITLSGLTNSLILLRGPGGLANPSLGNSILDSGSYPVVGQYAFDVSKGSTLAGNATYVFATMPSGSIFYYVPLINKASSSVPGFGDRSNPLPNQNTFVDSLLQENTYINYNPALMTQQIPNILAIPQDYFVSQVDTPKFKKIQVFYDYILGIGDPNFNSRLWYSEQYAPQIWGESFNYAGFIDVDKDNGSPLVSMEKLREYMILFKKNATYRVEFLGNSNQPFSIAQISSKIGSLGAFGTITVGNTVYGLSQYGVFAVSGGNSVQIISDSIKPFYDDLNHADLTFAVALHNMNHSTITWSITNDSFDPESNIGIIFNYKEGSFSVYKGPMWNIAATVENEDGFDVLLGGTSDGQIEIEESKTSKVDVFFNDGEGFQASRDIEFIAETPWLSVDDSQSQKQIKFIDINTNNVDTILGVDVFINQDEDTPIYSRGINVNVKGSDKRVTLGNQAKTIKLKFHNIGNSPTLKINNISIYYIPIGHMLPS